VKYLFDTDIISNLLGRVPSSALVRRLAMTPAVDQATSSITLGELHFGARRLRTDGEQLLERIESILARTTLVPFDAAAGRFYGAIRAELERAGTPIGDADTRIAAIAMVNNLTVVTGNIRHFQRVAGLAVENWLD